MINILNIIFNLTIILLYAEDGFRTTIKYETSGSSFYYICEYDVHEERVV